MKASTFVQLTETSFHVLIRTAYSTCAGAESLIPSQNIKFCTGRARRSLRIRTDELDAGSSFFQNGRSGNAGNVSVLTNAALREGHMPRIFHHPFVSVGAVTRYANGPWTAFAKMLVIRDWIPTLDLLTWDFEHFHLFLKKYHGKKLASINTSCQSPSVGVSG